jgi:hypothetical protein
MESDRPECHSEGDDDHDPLMLVQPVSQAHLPTVSGSRGERVDLWKWRELAR